MILTKTVIHRGKEKNVVDLPVNSTHEIEVECPKCKRVRVTAYRSIVKNGHCKCFACVKKEDRAYLSIGEKYHKLTVVGHSERSGYSKVSCDCGEQLEVLNHRIVAGRTKSCGCLRTDNFLNIRVVRHGENHPNWKGGVSKERERHMSSKSYKDWRKAVFERDGYTCQSCKNVGGELNAHHIYGYADFPELREDVDNGITLCLFCHRELHHLFGRKTTRVDLDNYLQNNIKF